MSETTVAEIETMEDRRWAAQIGGDLDALEELLADELQYTHSNGLVDTKTSYIRAIDRQIFDYQGEKRTDVAVVVIGETAMVTGRVEIDVIAGGGQRNLDSRYSAIWIRRNGSWQFLCWQSTPLA